MRFDADLAEAERVRGRQRYRREARRRARANLRTLRRSAWIVRDVKDDLSAQTTHSSTMGFPAYVRHAYRYAPKKMTKPESPNQ